MAEALMLVTRTNQEGDNGMRNGVHAMLINNDDADADSVTIADAVARLNAVYGTNAYPDDYFDTVQVVGDLTSGPLPDNGDFMAFLPRVVETHEA